MFIVFSAFLAGASRATLPERVRLTYLWCGGWRPTAALHLLYSKSGMQLEHQLPNFLNGGSLKGDLGDLGAEELQAADQLQRRTVNREREIEDAAASAQVRHKNKIKNRSS